MDAGKTNSGASSPHGLGAGKTQRAEVKNEQRLTGTGVSPANAVVVVPTYNERANIGKLVERLFELYPAIHVLVVDDHSPDGTAGAVRALMAAHGNLMLLERLENPGFGASYRDGFRKALAEPWCQAVITMDADFSHDPAAVGFLLEKLGSHAAAVGSRYTPGGHVRRLSLARRLLSQCANYYVRAVLGVPARDTTSGFMCMRREALERVPVEQTAAEGYAFLVELKFLLHRAGVSFAEHPIVFDEREEGESKMSAGKIWESIWMPWRVRLSAPRRKG